MKIHSICYCALVCFLISCGGDSLEDQLIGTWEISQIEYDCDDPSNNQTIQFTNGCAIIGSEEQCITMTLTSTGGTFIETDAGVATERAVTYTIDEGEKTVTICNDGECSSSPISESSMRFSTPFGDCEQFLTFVKR